MSELPANFRPDAFAGLADDYLRYRTPYPRTLLDHMLARAATPAAGGRLLDLACGPGRLTLAIADRFAEVLAVDAEPEMVAAGEREAARLGRGNIEWRVGRVERIEAPAHAFDLVTAAEAFHRFDQPKVASLAMGWLKPGSALVTMGFSAFTTGAAPWRRELAAVVKAYVGEPVQRLHGSPNPTLDDAIADQAVVLQGAGFLDVETFDFAVEHTWTLEALLGNLRSTSVLSRRALGDRHSVFEADLAATLRGLDPSERYRETLRCGYTISRSPG